MGERLTRLQRRKSKGNEEINNKKHKEAETDRRQKK